MAKRFYLFLFLLALYPWLITGCVGLKVSLETEAKAPLKEYTLQGSEKGKVLILPVRGMISQAPGKGLLQKRPSQIQEVVARLRMAEKDPDIKALLLEINSPGGSVTASDILYHEILSFKQRTGIKIVSLFMDMAASGAYYLALPSDRIIAHPTTITGSIGVIFINPKIAGMMDKLGLAVEVSKSGPEKDMGSPFRPSTAEEQGIFKELTEKLGKKFLSLVAHHRPIDPASLANIATARVYLAEEAVPLKLVDQTGYLEDALAEAKALAGLSPNSKVVVYRRSQYPNDTPYNTADSLSAESDRPLVELNLPEVIPDLNPGFYYLWMP